MTPEVLVARRQRHRPEMVWLSEQFDFSKYDTVWVGHTGYDKMRLSTSYFGIWYGYSEKGLIAELKFKFQETQKVHMLRRLYAGLLSIYYVLDNFHDMMGNAQIYLHSRQAARWFNDSTYKKNRLWFKEDLALLYKLMHPVVTHYNTDEPPFCAIKNLVTLELDRHAHSIGSYVSLADLNEPDL